MTLSSELVCPFLCPQRIFANIKTETKEDSERYFASVLEKLEREHSFIDHAEADAAEFSIW